MKILIGHNFYQQPGGEDQVYNAEAELLRQQGNHVVEFTRHNDDVHSMTSLELASNSLWSKQTYTTLRQLLRSFQPDVAHFHNTFPLLSPSTYYACAAERVPIVQTLHNYRLICPNALLLRNGAICEDCVQSRTFLPAVKHSCYRGSRAASITVATMLGLHHYIGTYTRMVSHYIALSNFARGKFVTSGLPADRISVKPNFLPSDPGIGNGAGNFVLYVGRLGAEKGIDLLIEAWKHVKDPELFLYIVGDGPLAEQVRSASTESNRIRWLGPQPRGMVMDLMKQAKLLLFPSICYEGMPLAIIEAYACGLPVVSSRMGSMVEMVGEGVTGFLFHPGDPGDLRKSVEFALSNPTLLAEMRQNARALYERDFSTDKNYDLLFEIYRRAIIYSNR